MFPALALADALCARGMAKEDIVFFGGDRMEATTIPAAGFPFVALDVHGLRRSLSMDNIALPYAEVTLPETDLLDNPRYVWSGSSF